MSDVPAFDLVDVFEEYVRTRVTIDARGCWLWNLSTDRDGYANGKGGRMHRRTYEHFVGPIPTGLELDHTCEVRHCINPDHLEPVTTLENRVRHHLRAGRSPKDAEQFAAWDLDMFARSRALNGERPPTSPGWGPRAGLPSDHGATYSGSSEGTRATSVSSGTADLPSAD